MEEAGVVLTHQGEEEGEGEEEVVVVACRRRFGRVDLDLQSHTTCHLQGHSSLQAQSHLNN